jgi:hypothetical protein
LSFNDKFDILLEKRLSDVVEPLDRLRTDKDIRLFMENAG